MKIGLRVSLKLGMFNGDNLTEMIDQFVKFQPCSFTYDVKTKPWDEKKHRKVIENYDGSRFLAISDTNRNSLSIGPANKRHAYLSFVINQEKNLFSPTDGEITGLLKRLPGVISAYLFDEEYVYVQSQIFENNLLGRAWPEEVLKAIRNTPFKIGVHGTKEYDVRFNPGREILMDHSWLMAAWKIWLAPPFFVLVPEEKILSFPHAIEITKLAFDLVYIQLFERLEESYSPESMFRQWKWQEWLDFDALVENQDSW